MLPGVPYLEYDDKKKTVQVTPDNVKDFLGWVESATEYPNMNGVR